LLVTDAIAAAIMDPAASLEPLIWLGCEAPEGASRGLSHPLWVEVHPERCPGCGEPYRGGHVAVGWLACQCPNALTDEHWTHRTLYRRDCGFGRFLPPHLVEHGPAAV